MLASRSSLSTDDCDQLHESSQKINIVDRLSRHLQNGSPVSAAGQKMGPSEPMIHIDDSNVVKPDGCKLESLGIVRDSPESRFAKNVY